MANKSNHEKKVSIILPTYNRYEVAAENVKTLLGQAYENIEIIVCDDSDRDYYIAGNKAFQDIILSNEKVKYKYCAKFDINGVKDYGLARARNHGVIESTGEFLVFLDDRITVAKSDAIAIFADKLKRTKDKVWFFGDKGAQKTNFVENFSAIRRNLMVDGGFFFERIDKYGGMTRELFARFTHQGFKFIYVPEAKGMQICKSRGWDKKPGQIEEMRALLERIWNV